jgi:hypothetical protein
VIARVRRLARGLVLVTVVLTVCVLAASLALRVWGAAHYRAAAERFEQEVGSLDPASYAPPAVPERENAVTWLRRGVAAVFLDGEEEKGFLSRLERVPPSAWSAADVERVRALVERNRPALDLADAARRLPRSDWSIPYADGNLATLPKLLDGVYFARLAAADARLALRERDFDRLVARVEAVARLARSYQDERVMIVVFVGWTLERIQLAVIREAVADPTVPREVVLRLGPNVVQNDPEGALRTSFAWDAVGIVQVIRRDPAESFNARYNPTALRPYLRWKGRTFADHLAADLLDRTREDLAVPSGPWADRKEALAVIAGRNASPLPVTFEPYFSLSGPLGRALSLTGLRNTASQALAMRAEGGGPARLEDAEARAIFREVAPPGTDDAVYVWNVPAPTPPAAPSSSSPTTPVRRGTPPSLHPPARTPPR